MPHLLSLTSRRPDMPSLSRVEPPDGDGFVYEDCQQETRGCIYGVVVSAVKCRGCDQECHNQKKAAYPFVLGKRSPHAESGGKGSGHMGARKDASMDSVIA